MPVLTWTVSSNESWYALKTVSRMFSAELTGDLNTAETIIRRMMVTMRVSLSALFLPISHELASMLWMAVCNSGGTSSVSASLMVDCICLVC